jgi:hypothetical protein
MTKELFIKKIEEIKSIKDRYDYGGWDFNGVTAVDAINAVLRKITEHGYVYEEEICGYVYGFDSKVDLGKVYEDVLAHNEAEAEFKAFINNL